MKTSDYCEAIDQAREECIQRQEGDPNVFGLLNKRVTNTGN
jgi:hypothetical protein